MHTIQPRLTEELTGIRESGLYKDERIIQSPQSAEITGSGLTVVPQPATASVISGTRRRKVMAAAPADCRWDIPFPAQTCNPEALRPYPSGPQGEVSRPPCFSRFQKPRGSVIVIST